MSFLAFIFFFIITILLFGLSVIGGILKAIFGLGRRSSSATNTSNTSSSNQTNSRENKNDTSYSKKHKKVFDKEDGEYVDFEEVKDSEK